MNAITAGAETPSQMTPILKLLFRVLNHESTIICFCVACLIFDFVGIIQSGDFIDAWWGGFFALIVLVATLVTTFVICLLLSLGDDSKPYARQRQSFEKVFSTTLGGWLIFGPPFAMLATFAFIVYPVENKVLVVDGEKMNHWTWVNPWSQRITYVNYHHPVNTTATATCKEGVRVRGNISAEFVLVENPKTYLSNNEISVQASEVLAQCFEDTVSKLTPQELEHTITIEFGVGRQADLTKLGIVWKKGSVIKVSSMHAAPPGS